MNTHGRRSQRDRITSDAAEWFVRAQDPDFSAAERKELSDWLSGSAEHVREYLQLAALTQDISELTMSSSIDELINAACHSNDNANVFALSGTLSGGDFKFNPDLVESEGISESTPPATGRSKTVWWASAAAGIVAVCAVIWLNVISVSQVYATGVGEQVSFPLSDGSVVTLNAQSKIQLSYTEHERNVRLIAGEALFVVSKDSERPFQVMTDNATIRAIGTAFNVRQRGAGMTVTVVEGTIEVLSNDSEFRQKLGQREQVSLGLPDRIEPVRVSMGQQARVLEKSGQVAVLNANTDKVIAWRERRLVFESRPLSAAVEEFNLYNDQRIIILDVSLANRPISGVFSADDRESFALFLREAGLAQTYTRDDGTITLSAHESKFESQ